MPPLIRNVISQSWSNQPLASKNLSESMYNALYVQSHWGKTSVSRSGIQGHNQSINIGGGGGKNYYRKRIALQKGRWFQEISIVWKW